MGQITLSGCARNDWITRDEVECDAVVPGAATRRDPSTSDQVTKVMMFLLHKNSNKNFSFSDKPNKIIKLIPCDMTLQSRSK